jgi:transcription-repair coupling factor (superfamily II helicase)
VRELHGEPTAAAVEPVISVPVEGLLPEDYVPEVNQRLALYKRLAAAENESAVSELGAELADRFGPLPPVARQLLDTVRIRVAARALAVEKVEVGEEKALITFAPTTQVDPQTLVQAVQRSRGRLRFKREFTLEATIPRAPWPAVRDAVLRLLAEMH